MSLIIFTKLHKAILESDRKLLFILICLITFLLLLVKKNFIESEIAAFELLEQEGSIGLIKLFNAFQYLTIPIVYLWKFTVSGFLLWIGCFLFGYKINFTQCWGVVMAGEIIFFIPEIIKIFHFTFIQTDPDIFQVRAYYPLSLISFFDYQTLPDKWHYPLKAFNLFEVLYWFILVHGIYLLSRKSFRISFYIVFFSYVPFFLVWLFYWVIVYQNA